MGPVLVPPPPNPRRSPPNPKPLEDLDPRSNFACAGGDELEARDDQPPSGYRLQQHLPPPAPARHRGHFASSSSPSLDASSSYSSEYALLSERMSDGHGFQPLGHHHQHHHGGSHALSFAPGEIGGQLFPPPPPSHSRLRSVGGEIVAVQGGHIVRATGRKDRHSKVCTAKGPRDRRVRLSAHTAIQFYDVQDRLGYDRPSKAVDWLMKNAKDAIDKLAGMPPPRPPPQSTQQLANAGAATPSCADDTAGVAPAGLDFGGGGGGGFLPLTMDSDAIADTIKSFFPTSATSSSAAAASSGNSGGYRSYTPDLLSRTGSRSQELQLSLQSFQDSLFRHDHHHSTTQHSSNPPTPLFHGAPSFFFGASSGSWAEQSQRISPWNLVEAGGGGGNYGFGVSAPMAVVQQQQLLGQSGQFFVQREPLQSSNAPVAASWAEPILDQAGPGHLQIPSGLYMMPEPPSVRFGVGGSGGGGYSSGLIRMTRDHVEDQQVDGDVSAKMAPPASSGSHH